VITHKRIRSCGVPTEQACSMANGPLHVNLVSNSPILPSRSPKRFRRPALYRQSASLPSDNQSFSMVCSVAIRGNKARAVSQREDLVWPPFSSETSDESVSIADAQCGCRQLLTVSSTDERCARTESRDRCFFWELVRITDAENPPSDFKHAAIVANARQQCTARAWGLDSLHFWLLFCLDSLFTWSTQWQ
jgi:hypothetical protein